jgi:hypothetical protein
VVAAQLVEAASASAQFSRSASQDPLFSQGPSMLITVVLAACRLPIRACDP